MRGRPAAGRAAVAWVGASRPPPETVEVPEAAPLFRLVARRRDSPSTTSGERRAKGTGRPGRADISCPGTVTYSLHLAQRDRERSAGGAVRRLAGDAADTRMLWKPACRPGGGMPHATDEDLDWGTALAMLRIFRSWTQGQLGHAVGLGYRTVSNYEKGLRTAPPALLRQMVAAMGFP